MKPMKTPIPSSSTISGAAAANERLVGRSALAATDGYTASPIETTNSALMRTGIAGDESTGP